MIIHHLHYPVEKWLESLSHKAETVEKEVDTRPRSSACESSSIFAYFVLLFAILHNYVGNLHYKTSSLFGQKISSLKEVSILCILDDHVENQLTASTL